jgi:ribonuclease HI
MKVPFRSSSASRNREDGSMDNPVVGQEEHAMTPIANIDVYCDGACRGNPGPAAIGIVAVDHASGTVIFQDGKTIGQGTNNIAEYKAIIWGLESVEKRYKAVTTVRVYSDSQLVIRQLNHEWKVKDENLQYLLEEVEDLAENFGKVFYKEVPRKHPTIQLADQEANKAFDG